MANYEYVVTQQLTGTVATVIAHGLPTAPDEFYVQSVTGLAAQFVSAPGTTNMNVSAAPGGGNVLVVARVNKTFIR